MARVFSHEHSVQKNIIALLSLKISNQKFARVQDFVTNFVTFFFRSKVETRITMEWKVHRATIERRSFTLGTSHDANSTSIMKSLLNVT